MTKEFFASRRKLDIQLWLAVFLAFAGIVLIFFGFFVEPAGEISASVLSAVGEIFTFSGSVMGIDYHYRTKIFIKNKESEMSYGPGENKKEEQTG